MKENAEKARLYDEAQEQGKSELQKAQEAAAKAEARAAAMEAEAMRAKVAAATGVDDPSGARPAAVSTPGPR